MEHYKFFQNRKCEFFPCHQCREPSEFNCLFCYCPLYTLGDRCGGDFRYLDSGVKDCSACVRPHILKNYDEILEQMADVIELAKRI